METFQNISSALWIAEIWVWTISSRGGSRGARDVSPSQFNFFIFLHFPAKNMPNDRLCTPFLLLWGFYPTPYEILDPPLGSYPRTIPQSSSRWQNVFLKAKFLPWSKHMRQWNCSTSRQSHITPTLYTWSSTPLWSKTDEYLSVAVKFLEPPFSATLTS